MKATAQATDSTICKVIPLPGDDAGNRDKLKTRESIPCSPQVLTRTGCGSFFEWMAPSLRNQNGHWRIKSEGFESAAVTQITPSQIGLVAEAVNLYSGAGNLSCIEVSSTDEYQY